MCSGVNVVQILDLVSIQNNNKVCKAICCRHLLSICMVKGMGRIHCAEVMRMSFCGVLFMAVSMGAFSLQRPVQCSVCLSEADRGGVTHHGIRALIAASEHENWIQIDKSICGPDHFMRQT